MIATSASTAHAARPAPAVRGAPAAARQRIDRTLELLQRVPLTRRLLHAGEPVFRAGDALACLHVIHFGCVKTVNMSADGREQVAGLYFKGDWLGLDSIAAGRQGCDAVALDLTEVWAIPYAALLEAGAGEPALLELLHTAMSRELSRDRDAMLSLCTLPADARVADFLRGWAEALAERGLRTDQITIHMTRAEIGNYLGMKLETVSRALSRLAREKVIAFSETGRRDLHIPDVAALAGFVQRSLGVEAAALVH
ncbi:MAG: helix-turn-helix domain-containing protein [Burkholderiales bacterium]|nr:helix-turn-helix domain-containing protein [Burkholderiales bacterium]